MILPSWLRGRAAPALFAFLALGALAGCAAGARTPQGNARSWEIRTVSRTLDGCSPDSSDCSKVWMRFPVLTEARPSRLADSVNVWVRDVMTGGWTSPGESTEPDTVAARILAAFRSMREERRKAGAVETALYDETTIEVAGDTLGFVTLHAQTNSYVGGAHPGHFTRLGMFDAATGRRLQLAELVIPNGGLDSLTRRTEHWFRAFHQVPPDSALDTTRFWFDDGRFRLAKQSALIGKGLMVYYNEYEVMSYADGPTELVLPWAEVTPFLRLPPPASR